MSTIAEHLNQEKYTKMKMKKNVGKDRIQLHCSILVECLVELSERFRRGVVR